MRSIPALLALLSASSVALGTATAAAPSPSPAAATPAPAAAADGQDFAADARLLYRVVACAGEDTLPAHLDAKVVAEHCEKIAPMVRKAQTDLVEAKSFIAGLRPKSLPPTVVYPFGGGDLLSALTTYPDATDYTTLSLEHAGDPRRLATIDRARLSTSLQVMRRTIHGLLVSHNSTTENLQTGQRGEIPGELAFFVTALAVHGFEPVGLRFFSVNADGTLHYLSSAEIAANERVLARRLRGQWASPDVSVSFSNMELRFKPRGAAGPVRIHRHFAADLSDAGLARSPGVLAHLKTKGRIAAMTKAASYMLWRNDFGTMRGFLLDHMEFMISDSTGIPPKFVPARFQMETYGSFSGSFLRANEAHNVAFRALWNDQPKRALPFRYGYLDSALASHMLVVRPAP